MKIYSFSSKMLFFNDEYKTKSLSIKIQKKENGLFFANTKIDSTSCFDLKGEICYFQKKKARNQLALKLEMRGSVLFPAPGAVRLIKLCRYANANKKHFKDH